MHRRVAIGFLGTVLDAGGKNGRQKWRPTIGMCQQDGLFIDRLELIHDTAYARLAKNVVKEITHVSPGTEVQLHKMDVEDPWDFAEMYTGMLDFAQGYEFDPEREDYLVNITTGTHVAQICWFLLTEANYIPGRLLQLSPPKRSEVGPDDNFAGNHSIIDLDLSRYDSITTRFDAAQAEATSFLKSGIETRNKPFNAMIDQIEKVAIRSRAPVLLSGPTGAGKSQLAKRIFELKKSQRQVSGSFVEVNCATLRGDQAMSTLFGHARGSFTGAQNERAGLMKAADKGVLFLDEIGELGLDEQAMCLRAIEEKRFFPFGSDKEIASDFQLLAGTNRDLSKSVREGKFREDLFARLNIWTFQLPALSERREDIEPNIEYELDRFGRAEGQNITFNKEARERYVKFALSSKAAWSANFRDLSASITRMGTLAPRSRIDEETVSEEIARLTHVWAPHTEPQQADLILETTIGLEGTTKIDLFDRAQLAAVIEVCQKSKSMSEAGRTLFACSRQNKTSGNDTDRVRKYLTRFGLTFGELSE